MIKIIIPDETKFISDYCSTILPPLQVRINDLIVTIDYIQGKKKSLGTEKIKSIKALVKKLIDLANSGFNIASYSFNQNVFFNHLTAVVPNVNFSSLNLTQVKSLLLHLLEANNLEDLLKKQASGLKITNDSLLTQFGLGPNSKDVLKLAFNYEDHDKDISSKVRTLFKEKNLTHTCPYCNIEQTKYLVNSNNKTAHSFQLDHFFDKATHPLLCFSIFNLVPSGYNCNVTNKGSIHFTDDFHLNPYDEGFGDHVKFEAISLGNKKYSIQLNPNKPTSLPIHKKVLGDPKNKNDLTKGNANVFELRALYQDLENRVDRIVKKAVAYSTIHKKGISRFFTTEITTKEELKASWYENDFDYAYYENDFHKFEYSKFAKDIFEQYYT